MRAWWRAVGMGSGWRSSPSRCSVVPRRCDADCTASLAKGSRAGRSTSRWTASSTDRNGAQQDDRAGEESTPGWLETQADGTMVARDEDSSAKFRLNALVQAAKEADIQVKRSQIRTILLCERVRWRRTHRWGTSTDKDFVGSRTAVVSHYTEPPQGSTTICTDELGPVIPRTLPPQAGPSPGTASKLPWTRDRGPEKT